MPPADSGERNGKAALRAKLGLERAGTVTLVREPPGVIGPLGADVRVRRRLVGRSDVVVVFVRRAGELRAATRRLGEAIFPDGALWVAWPKRASGEATDLSDEVVRTSLLPHGLVDTKVCSIDEVWSGLKFVWRKERRATRPTDTAG